MKPSLVKQPTMKFTGGKPAAGSTGNKDSILRLSKVHGTMMGPRHNAGEEGASGGGSDRVPHPTSLFGRFSTTASQCLAGCLQVLGRDTSISNSLFVFLSGLTFLQVRRVIL